MRYGRPIIETFVGATGRTLTFHLMNEDGTDYDLTNYTAVKLSANLGETAKVSASAMTVDADPTSGLVTWQDSTGDLDTAGDYKANIRLEASGGVDFTPEFIIRAIAPVDN